VLRGAETTINKSSDFRVYRPQEGGPEDDLQWRPLRQGIADLHRRAEVAQNANNRLLNALATVDDSRSVEEWTTDIQKPVTWGGRRVRGLRPWGDDHALLLAIHRGEFLIHGLRNRDLQKLWYAAEPESLRPRRRRSAAISRKLRRLRFHGLIKKVNHTHRYPVTDAGPNHHRRRPHHCPHQPSSIESAWEGRMKNLCGGRRNQDLVVQAFLL